MNQLTDEQIREAWERTEIYSISRDEWEPLPEHHLSLRIKPARIERWVVVGKMGTSLSARTS